MAKHIEFSGISKYYPGIRALGDVSFTAHGGKVLALLGENGAGKSTLLKTLSGDIRPDAGYISIDGVRQNFRSPPDSLKAGISVICQESQLVPEISVSENIYAGSLPGRAGLVNYGKLRDDTRLIIEKFGLSTDPDAPVRQLSVAMRQMVEIMKAYRRDSFVVAFDEPTASLADAEIATLFRIINELKAAGKIIIYVSHRISEIFRISDDIAILKDGRLVKTLKTADTDQDELISAMVGRNIGDTYANLSRNEVYGDTLLEISNLETDRISDFSLSVRKGEVVGFAGLVGAGRTEVVRAIFGADAKKSGKVVFDGRELTVRSPKDAIRAGMALCPEDRKEQGLVLFRSVKDNVTMPVLGLLSKWVFFDKKAGGRLADDVIEQYRIKTPSAENRVFELSGGNQQKVILGRWTHKLSSAKLLILDEPTKGIDVGTKAEIYRTVCELAKRGMGIIFISSELTEVINVSDRIIVMKGGRVTGEVRREDATEEKILALAMKD